MNKRILPAALAVFVLAAAAAQAQTPPAAPPKAPPKAAPAPAPKAAPKGPAPAPQQPQQQAQPDQQQMPQLIYSQWTRFCLKGQEANAKQFCFTGKDGRLESGQVIVAVVIIEPEGEQRKLLRVTLPLGVSLPQGTRIIIDQNEANSKQSPYAVCIPNNGCVSDYEATADVIANLKKATTLYVQFIQINGVPTTVPVPLAEFAKAFDGPPTDPKVLEEQSKKLQEDLNRRAKEMREKLEQQGQANPGAAPK
jgi:invasion protein IalB